MDTDKILKYLIYLGVALLLYIPFIVANEMFFPFITGKAYTFRVITEIIFGLWLILAVLYPAYRPKKSWILYTFGAFLISIFISGLMGVNQTASFWSNYERMEGWVTLAHLFALFVALGSTLKDKKEWFYLLNASIIASLFMVSSAVSEIIEYGKTIIDGSSVFGIRVDTSLGNSTYLGIYMLMNAFFSIYLLFKSFKDKGTFNNWYSYFYVLALILQVWVMVQTGTRGSMLGFIGGIILMSLIIVFLNKENKLLRKISLIVLAATIVFAASVFIFKDSALIKSVPMLERLGTTSLEGSLSQARITNWKMAIDGFKERPLFGWGQSNFNYVFDKHYRPEHYGNEVWFDRVHNIVFDWLIAGGIWGLLFYLSIWLSLIWIIFRTDKFDVNEKAVLIGLLAAYFFHNLFVFDQIVSYIYFVFILAFVYSQTSTNYPNIQKEIPERLRKLLVILIFVSIPATLYYVNYQSYSANKELLNASALISQTPDGKIILRYERGVLDNIEYFKKAISRNTFGTTEARERIIIMFSNVVAIKNLDPEIRNKYIEFAVEQMQKQIKEHPNNSRYYYMLGTFMAQIGKLDLAEQYLLKAIEISPNKQYIRLPLIRFYVFNKESEKAIALARETYELDTSKNPLWGEYVKTVAVFNMELFNELLKESIEEGKTKRVENMLLENITNNPDSLKNRISLAAFYFQAGSSTESLRVLDDTAEKFPEAKIEIEKIKKQIADGKDPVGQSF